MEVPKIMYRVVIWGLLISLIIGCTSLDPLPQIEESPKVYTPRLFSIRTANGPELRWGWLSMGGSQQPYGLSAEKFVIFQAIDQYDTFTEIAETSGDTFSFALDQLDEGHSYFYRIQAYASEENNEFSSIIQLTSSSLEQKETFWPESEESLSHGSFTKNSDQISFQLDTDSTSYVALGKWGESKVQLVIEGEDPAWNHLQNHLAFQSIQDTSTGGIQNALQVVDPDNSFLLESTLGGDAPYLQPDWGDYQGRQDWISYISTVPSSDLWGIFIYNPTDGAEPTLIKDVVPDNSLGSHLPIGRPVWYKREESFLAYEIFKPKLYRNDTSYWVRDIQSINVNSRSEKYLVESMWDDFAPSVSNDGNYMAFLSNRSGKTEIWLKDLNSQKFTQLTGSLELNPSRKINKLAWSPDGKYLLYTHEDVMDRNWVCRLKVN
ncbi:MAG: hypothetical protein MRZ79_16060 [Bacteroidia bacterium]|nr:hypothetical protein [Bacteroidia bacterium]